MRPVSLVLATALLATAALPSASAAQGGGFVPGSRELFSIDFAAEPLGEFPRRLELRSGHMDMVMKDGVPALKASDLAEFVIHLTERLPQDFTLEFDLIPKASGNPQDISFEGTPVISQSTASMHVMWQPRVLMVVGGGPTSETKMPPEIEEVSYGQPTEVRVSFQGTTMQFYVNGQQTATLTDRQFARGRVLRVFLGAKDDDKYAVYLTKLRVAAR
jgi:hypothetical protein